MERMPFAADLFEFLKLMISAEAEFLVVGAYTVEART